MARLFGNEAFSQSERPQVVRALSCLCLPSNPPLTPMTVKVEESPPKPLCVSAHCASKPDTRSRRNLRVRVEKISAKSRPPNQLRSPHNSISIADTDPAGNLHVDVSTFSRGRNTSV
jgi:hypothetical protein